VEPGSPGRAFMHHVGHGGEVVTVALPMCHSPIRRLGVDIYVDEGDVTDLKHRVYATV